MQSNLRSWIPIRNSFEGVVVDVDDDYHNVEYEGDDQDDNEDDHDDDEGGEMSDVCLHQQRGRVTGDSGAQIRAETQVVIPLITDNAQLGAGHFLSTQVVTDINNGDPVSALAAVPHTTGDFLRLTYPGSGPGEDTASCVLN